jgi:hypothetical protein
MVFATTSWVGNWIIVIIWGFFLSILIYIMNGAMGVLSNSMSLM